MVVAAARAATPLAACFWDYDTLIMEQQRFPTALELITGKFLRHSPEFYAWRIQDRLRKLAADPDNLALLDDLAVAYEKSGDHAKAIDTALLQEKLAPDRYETLANLGTFRLHAGEFVPGRAAIQRAIEINPQAHFGREIYQALLVQYVLQRRPDGQLTLPLDPEERWTGREALLAGSSGSGNQLPNQETRRAGFGFFVLTERKVDWRGPGVGAEIAAATKGVLGIMRFGSHDHPVLHEVLGDLLLTDIMSDAKQLAARAYLRASYAAKDESVVAVYRKLASRSLSGFRSQLAHTSDPRAMSLQEVETAFKVELADAEAWYARVRVDELTWIRDGKDPEREFATKYYASVAEENESSGLDDWLAVVLGAAIALLALCIGLGIRQERRRSRATAAAGKP
ncbi:MAG: hypothetical protein HZA54_13015 [Planctomycetes bacterium]|nr:hypothetical protein [Planctomycetota bacterium]